MKLLHFDDFRLGVLKDDRVVDVTAALDGIPHTGPGDRMSGLIARWDTYKPRTEQAAAAGSGVPVAVVRIRPPLPKPGNIDCMAVNYMEDGTLKEPAPINAFHKSSSAVIGHGDTMVLPDAPVKLYVTASAAVRARRRHEELLARAETSLYERVRAEIEARDARDAGRAVAPMRQADDAVEIDTTDLTPEQVLARALAVIDARK